MTAQDIRWMQRFNHFQRALAVLEEAVALAASRKLSNIEQQGLIQAFEFTHELAWNTLKDFLESRGAGTLYGSRDTTRASFERNLIADGETWMDMINSRNLTSHAYNEATAIRIAAAICDSYVKEYRALRATLERLKKEEE